MKRSFANLVDFLRLAQLCAVNLQFLLSHRDTDPGCFELRHERVQLVVCVVRFVNPALTPPGKPRPQQGTRRFRLALARSVPVPECTALVASFHIARAVGDIGSHDGIDEATRLRKKASTDIRRAVDRPLRADLPKLLRLRLRLTRGVLSFSSSPP